MNERECDGESEDELERLAHIIHELGTRGRGNYGRLYNVEQIFDAKTKYGIGTCGVNLQKV